MRDIYKLVVVFVFFVFCLWIAVSRRGSVLPLYQGTSNPKPVIDWAHEVPNPKPFIDWAHKEPNPESFVDWDQRFWFVPNDVRNCNQLFQGNIQLPLSVNKAYENYQSMFYNITKLKQPREDYTAEILPAIKAYLELASHSSVKTICETGFNGGHSSFGWLTVNRQAHLYTFDIGLHRYARPMAQYIQTLYPERFNITWGDSTKTLPDFHRQHPDVLCDLVVIDGGHTTGICRADLVNFQKMTSKDNVLILDNYPQKSDNFRKTLGDVWEWAKRNGKISEIFRCHVESTPYNFGFSVGRYLKQK